MTVQDVMRVMESWAPRPLAWDKDNVGLLIGSASRTVRRIMVALDVTTEVVDEAKKRSTDLLITHHPLLFRGVRTITDRDRTGCLVAALIRNDIALYAAHTNLDFTTNGVSAVLARTLGLSELEVLHPEEGRYQKIAVFVPASHAPQVMEAMAAAGAGKIGNYDSCTFQSEGNGTFRPLAGSQPYIGTTGKLETVPEIRIEMILPAWRAQAIIAAMRAAHPYEEPAFDVYALANVSSEWGAGIIGTLSPAQTLNTWLATVRKALKVPALRYTGDPGRKIRRVAVCGGSGSDLLPVAISRGADALVTADIKYHTFQDAEGAIALIDAGHFETEQPIVREIVSYLAGHCRKHGIDADVVAARRSRNPVQYSIV